MITSKSVATAKTAFKEAAWIFVLSRLVIVMLTYLGISLISAFRKTGLVNCSTNTTACLEGWMHFDVFSYIDIAMHGYVNAKMTAFFPLFPLLLRVVDFLFGNSVFRYYLAGIFLSNVLFYFALVVLYLLVEDLFDTSVARTALFYFAFAPYALFYFIGYTESLFVFLCILTFFCLQKAIRTQKLIYWLLAGMSGFFAALSRSQGVLLAIPFFIAFIQHYLFRQKFTETTWRAKIMALAPIVLIPLGVGVYMLYLWIRKGDPLLFSKGEALYWGRTLTAPWISIGYGIKALSVYNTLQIQNVINLANILLTVIVLIIGWKRLPLHFTIFAAFLAVFPLLYPLGTADALTGLPRYMLIIFPIIIILASYKNTRVDKAYLAFALPLFALNVLMFVNHYWVA